MYCVKIIKYRSWNVDNNFTIIMHNKKVAGDAMCLRSIRPSGLYGIFEYAVVVVRTADV